MRSFVRSLGALGATALLVLVPPSVAHAQTQGPAGPSAPGASPGAVDDIVLLKNGGRVRGTVFEEDPAREVRIRLADGSVRVIPAKDVKSVVYGSDAPPPPASSTAPAPAPAPAPAGSAPPSSPAPPPATDTSASAPAASTASGTWGEAPPEAPTKHAESAPSEPKKPSPPVVFSLGVRGGYGHSLDSSTDASNLPVIPLWVDAGVRFGGLYAGAFGAYGIIPSPPVACPLPATTCTESLYDVRAGVMLAYHVAQIRPTGAIDSAVDPWFGGGLGLEVFSDTSSRTSSSNFQNVATTRAQAEVNVQAGVDFRLAPAFGLGVFGALMIDGGNGTTAWPLVGARAVFDITTAH